MPPPRKRAKKQEVQKVVQDKKDIKDRNVVKIQKMDGPGGAMAAEGSKGAEGSLKEEFEIFYGSHTVFSQFYPCDFEVEGEKYCCMEQYMHHQKAVLFEDHEIAKQIMATQEPRKHKSLGRKVGNFDKKVWHEKAKEVVKKGSLAKYRQNNDLRKTLSATFPKTLVEASPRDRLWGIGLGPKNPLAHDRSKWRGKNQLGVILTEVRDILDGRRDEC